MLWSVPSYCVGIRVQGAVSLQDGSSAAQEDGSSVSKGRRQTTLNLPVMESNPVTTTHFPA